MQLIGLTGLAKSGKDTVGDYLKKDYMFQSYAFADPLKRSASEMFGIPLEDFYDQSKKEIVNKDWGYTPRNILQILGTEGARELFRKDIWTRRAELEIRRMCDEHCHGVVVTDVRFENEATMIRESGGVVVHIQRDVVAVESHKSENGVNVHGSDIVIDNNKTIEDLFTKVDGMMLVL